MHWAVLLKEWGGWGACLILIGVYLFARHRGFILTVSEWDRAERNTDRTVKLYEKQLDLSAQASAKKDETIARQATQIERLLSPAVLRANAIGEIVEEANRHNG